MNGVGVDAEKKQVVLLMEASQHELTDVLKALARAREPRTAARTLFWSWMTVSSSPAWEGLTVAGLRRKAQPVTVEGILEKDPPYHFRNDEDSALKPGQTAVLLGTRARLERFFQQMR